MRELLSVNDVSHLTGSVRCTSLLPRGNPTRILLEVATKNVRWLAVTNRSERILIEADHIDHHHINSIDRSFVLGAPP